MASTFSHLLKEYMERTGISDAELARSIGVRRQTIFRWKEGIVARPRNQADVLACAARLRLTLAETDALLVAAGFGPQVVPDPPPSSAPETTSPVPLPPSSQPSLPAPAPDRPKTLPLWGWIGLLMGLILVGMGAWWLWPATPGAGTRICPGRGTERHWCWWGLSRILQGKEASTWRGGWRRPWPRWWPRGI